MGGTHTVTIRLTDDVTGKYDERELTVTLSEASSRRSRKRRSSDTHQIRFALSPSGELSGTVQRDKTAGNNAQHRNKVVQHDANDIMRQIQQGSANSVASTVAPTTVSDRDPGAPSELEVTGSDVIGLTRGNSGPAASTTVPIDVYNRDQGASPELEVTSDSGGDNGDHTVVIVVAVAAVAIAIVAAAVIVTMRATIRPGLGAAATPGNPAAQSQSMGSQDLCQSMYEPQFVNGQSHV